MSESTQAERRDRLAAALKSLQPFEGRFVSRMSEHDKRTVRNVVEECGLMPQHVQGYSRAGKKPYVDLGPIREDLKRLDHLAAKAQALRACPAFEAYQAAIEQLGQAERRLRAEYGPDAINDAIAARAIAGHGRWL